MALELVYTSALQGLRAGTSGFCTVAMTKGMPPALVPRLEALGGYRAGPTGDGPISHCFWRVETASGIAHVLSIVGPAPPDHTARTNKIATYLVLSPNELAPAGPAALLSIPGLLRRSWSGAPAWIDQSVRIPAAGDAGIRPCAAWQAATGDAGWAGVLASSFLRDQSKPIHVIYGAGVDPLPLVDEAIRLLPDWARWRATFSTYFLQPVAGTPCSWRFCLEGTPAAEVARQSKGLVIDLSRANGRAPDSRFTRMARTGIDEEAAATKARDAARAPRQTRAAAERPIELEPDSGSNEPQHVRPTVARFREQAPAPEVPAAQPVKPMVIALVAAGLTLLVLLVVVLVLLSAKGKPAPAPPAGEQPAATALGTDRLQNQDLAEQASMAAAPMKASTARPPIPVPAAEPSPGFGADSLPSAVQPPSVPAGSGEAVPPSTPAPSIPAASTPAASTPAAWTPAPPPAIPVAAAPAPPVVPPASAVTAAPVPVAKWAMSFSSAGSTSSFASCELGGVKARTARIVVPADLRNAGAVADAAGGATFGSSELRASAHVEDGVLTVSVNGSGEVPDSLLPVLGKQSAGKPMSGVAAVQRALERCTVEVLDGAGGSLGLAQMRPRVTKPLMFAAKPSPLIVDSPDVPLNVQLLSCSAGETPAVTAADRAIAGRSTELAMGAWLRVVVDRGVQKSGLVLTAALQADVPARRTAISANVTSLNALKVSCSAVKDAAQSGHRGLGFETDLQAVRGALTDEELARVAPGASRADALDGPARMIAAADAVQSRVGADLLSASRSLNDLNEVSGNRPRLPVRVIVRIFNDDGIVLVESEVKAGSGGGS